jgi:hypothetical protein
MVEGSINLRWLNRRKHESEIAEAKAMVSQQDAEIAADQCSAGRSTTSIWTNCGLQFANRGHGVPEHRSMGRKVACQQRHCS